jgi:hypothetical protein
MFAQNLWSVEYSFKSLQVTLCLNWQLDLAPRYIFVYASMLLEQFDGSRVLHRAYELSYLLVAFMHEQRSTELCCFSLVRNGILSDLALMRYRARSQLLYQST